MAILTCPQIILVWIALTVFNPLFSFNSPTAPAVRLASDAQPLSTAYNCVSVISGNYFISEPNLTIDGPAPLHYTLTYDAGVRNNDGHAWGWHLQIPWRQGWFKWGKEKGQKKFIFASEQSENTNLAYTNKGFSEFEIPFEVAPECLTGWAILICLQVRLVVRTIYITIGPAIEIGERTTIGVILF